MYGRSISPALNRALRSRRVLSRVNWRELRVPPEWISSERGARISVRSAQAREAALRQVQERNGRCG